MLAERLKRRDGSALAALYDEYGGAVYSIADVVGCAVGIDVLGIERMVASPVATGRGFVEIAHGRCSLPAPATADASTPGPVRRAAGPTRARPRRPR